MSRKRNVAITILAVCLTGLSSIASAQDGTSAPAQGSWFTTITRINQVGANFTSLVSMTAGGVWQATGSNDRLNGGVSTLYGSWARAGENRYSSRAFFFAFDPVGNPVVLLRVDEDFKLTDQNHLEGAGLSYVCSLQGNGDDCVRTPQFDITFTANRIVPPGR